VSCGRVPGIVRTFSDRLRRRKHEAQERKIEEQIERELAAERRLDEFVSSFNILPPDRQRIYAEELAAIIQFVP
jgi:hypothetical protein